MNYLRHIAVLALLLLTPMGLFAEELPEELEGVGVVEQLGEFVDLSLEFTDHNGETVTLGDYVEGDLPVIFTMNYYGCPMLCGLQLNAFVDGLKDLAWAPGENFRIVTLSFDPSETSELAAAKRDSYLEELGRGDVEWSFLVGSEANITAIAEQVGFSFRYIESQGEYAHPAAVMFISPEGMISRYLSGLIYESRDLRLAILEASEGRVGSFVDHLFLSCFVYDPETGGYVRDAMLVMRLGGVLTVIIIGVFLVIMWRRERTAATILTN
jgi:protein SCO1/2